MALRTSGHLLLGVVRIYSRKAKYLLADCNEAFMKIKMAFRPGIVDLQKENREAAIAALTWQEDFHGFETTMADLDGRDVIFPSAHFSMNQCRPEEITLTEDLLSVIEPVNFFGDDSLGPWSWDEDPFEFPLFERAENCHGLMGQNYIGADLYADSSTGQLEISIVTPASLAKGPEPGVSAIDEAEVEETVSQACSPCIGCTSNLGDTHSSLIQDEEEVLVHEPINNISVPGPATKTKIKRKVRKKGKSKASKHKEISGEAIKHQFLDTSDIAAPPPAKRILLSKHPSAVKKVFVRSGGRLISKTVDELYCGNLACKAVSNNLEPDISGSDQDMVPEIARENECDSSLFDVTWQSEMSTIAEDDSIQLEQSVDFISGEQSCWHQLPQLEINPTRMELDSVGEAPSQPLFDKSLDLIPLLPAEVPFEQTDVDLTSDLLQNNGHLSVQPLSLSRPSRSVPPIMTFDDLEQEVDAEGMPENAEQEEKRWSKRTQQMQQMFEHAFTFSDTLSFKDMARNHNRKQAASRFYTLLVLKKHQAVVTEQLEPFGDILISQGPNFGVAC